MSWYPSDPTGRCVVQNSANFSYEDFACLYESTIGKTMTPIEAVYNPIYVRDWMRENSWVPVVAILGYGIMIAVGKFYFAKRNAWSWRTCLALWNFGLSAFSLVGFCRVAPQLLHNLYHYSLQENLCFDPEQMYGSDRMIGTWVQLFVLSKFPYVNCQKFFRETCKDLYKIRECFTECSRKTRVFRRCSKVVFLISFLN